MRSTERPTKFSFSNDLESSPKERVIPSASSLRKTVEEFLRMNGFVENLVHWLDGDPILPGISSGSVPREQDKLPQVLFGLKELDPPLHKETSFQWRRMRCNSGFHVIDIFTSVGTFCSLKSDWQQTFLLHIMLDHYFGLQNTNSTITLMKTSWKCLLDVLGTGGQRWQFTITCDIPSFRTAVAHGLTISLRT